MFLGYESENEAAAMLGAVEKMFEAKQEKKPVDEKAVKDHDTAMFEAIEQAASMNARALGMSTVISWVETGEPTATDFDEMAQGAADLNEDGEITDDETEAYNEILRAMSQALSSMMVSDGDIELLLSGNDDAANKAYLKVAQCLEEKDKSSSELIAEFSVGEKMLEGMDEDQVTKMMEGQPEHMLEAKVKVIRGGKVKWVKRPLKKRRLSSAQRAALKKARMKANSSAAKAKRKKAMRKRKSMGL